MVRIAGDVDRIGLAIGAGVTGANGYAVAPMTDTVSESSCGDGWPWWRCAGSGCGGISLKIPQMVPDLFGGVRNGGQFFMIVRLGYVFGEYALGGLKVFSYDRKVHQLSDHPPDDRHDDGGADQRAKTTCYTHEKICPKHPERRTHERDELFKPGSPTGFEKLM